MGIKLERLTNADANNGIATNVEMCFYCPGCRSYHSFTIQHPNNNRIWTFNGDMEKPTFSPSLLVSWGNESDSQRCHSFVRDGKIQFLDDCTHPLAGKTVDMLDVEHYNANNNGENIRF